MKLLTFTVENQLGSFHRIGAVEDATVIDLTAAYATLLENRGVDSPIEAAEEVVPPNMLSFLRRGDRGKTAAMEAVEFVSRYRDSAGVNGAQLTYELENLTLRSPLPRPNSIRDYATFEDHIINFQPDGINEIWYEIPLYTRRNHNSIIHPEEDVVYPEYTEELDFELELVAVIGKQGRNIAAEDATDYIAGYTIYNDFSSRDIQSREREMKQQGRGKNPLNAFGPYLVTPDEVDLDETTMTAKINGEVVSEGLAGDMHHSFPYIIEYLSASETIYPGEILASGTIPGGSGLELDYWIEPGDTIEFEVDGLGVLRNQIVSPE